MFGHSINVVIPEHADRVVDAGHVRREQWRYAPRRPVW